MKKFNCICLATLLVCSTHYQSNLCADTSEFAENYNEAVDSHVSTTDEIELSDSVSDTEEVCPCTQENINNDSENIPTQTVSDQAITNEIENQEVIVTQEETAVESDFDSMVNELVQSGAVEDDISVIESQPKWKLLLARIGSYTLSLGITCKQLVVNMYSNVQNTITDYWSNKNSN